MFFHSFSRSQVAMKKSSNGSFFHSKRGIGLKGHHLSEMLQCFHKLITWEQKKTRARGKRNHKFRTESFRKTTLYNCSSADRKAIFFPRNQLLKMEFMLKLLFWNSNELVQAKWFMRPSLCRKARFGIIKSWFLERIWLYQQCSDQRKFIDQVYKKIYIHLIAKYNLMVHIY